MNNSKHVKIIKEKVEKLAQNLRNKTEDVGRHPLIPQKNLKDWVFLVSLINFSFWPDEGKKFEVEYKGELYRGYWAMCAIIKNLMDSGKDIADPRNWDSKDTKLYAWFLQFSDYVPMLNERIAVLGEAHNVLKGVEFDMSHFIRPDINSTLDALIDAFPSLRYLLSKIRDWCDYDGERVYFLKRAQIMLADWYTLEPEKFPFWEIGTLTMFADYRVPAVLHNYGDHAH